MDRTQEKARGLGAVIVLPVLVCQDFSGRGRLTARIDLERWGEFVFAARQTEYYIRMNRRTFLTTGLGAAACHTLSAASTASAKIDRSRLSAITDETAHSPAEAIEFAHTYGLKWLSLRDVPGVWGKSKSYISLEADELKQAAKTFKDEGIRIAFLDTPFLKFSLPGTEPKRRTPETAEAKEKRIARDQVAFDRRISDLRRGFAASVAFECPSMRIFTFSRVAEPESVFPRLADVIGEMAELSKKEGVRLLIENEASQNAGTSAETAALVKLLPSNVGVNWDSLNALPLGEKPYPDGYNAIPRDRMWNVHVKGKSLLDYPEKQDWPAIVHALERDGFQGKLELETHIFGETQVASSHASMKELLRLLA